MIAPKVNTFCSKPSCSATAFHPEDKLQETILSLRFLANILVSKRMAFLLERDLCGGVGPPGQWSFARKAQKRH